MSIELPPQAIDDRIAQELFDLLEQKKRHEQSIESFKSREQELKAELRAQMSAAGKKTVEIGDHKLVRRVSTTHTIQDRSELVARLSNLGVIDRCQTTKFDDKKAVKVAQEFGLDTFLAETTTETLAVVMGGAK